MDVKLLSSDKEKIDLRVIFEESLTTRHSFLGTYFIDRCGRKVRKSSLEFLGDKFSVKAKGELTGSLYTEYTLPQNKEIPSDANAVIINRCGSSSFFHEGQQTDFREAYYAKFKN